MAIKVKDLLKEKGSQVWTIDVNATIKEALLLMAEKQIGAVPVMEKGQIRGMFSERDYVNYVAATGQAALAFGKRAPNKGLRFARSRALATMRLARACVRVGHRWRGNQSGLVLGNSWAGAR